MLTEYIVEMSECKKVNTNLKGKTRTSVGRVKTSIRRFNRPQTLSYGVDRDGLHVLDV